MKNLRKIFSTRFKRGTALVEFALAFPIFIFSLFFLIDLCRYYFIQQTFSHQIRQTLRTAIIFDSDNPGTEIVAGTPNTRSAIIEKVIEDSNLLNFDLDVKFVATPATVATPTTGKNVLVTVSPADGGKKDELLTIQMEYVDFKFLTPFVGSLGSQIFPLKASLAFAIENI